jgi:hypothetical protein
MTGLINSVDDGTGLFFPMPIYIGVISGDGSRRSSGDGWSGERAFSLRPPPGDQCPPENTVLREAFRERKKNFQIFLRFFEGRTDQLSTLALSQRQDGWSPE